MFHHFISSVCIFPSSFFDIFHSFFLTFFCHISHYSAKCLHLMGTINNFSWRSVSLWSEFISGTKKKFAFTAFDMVQFPFEFIAIFVFIFHAFLSLVRDVFKQLIFNWKSEKKLNSSQSGKIKQLICASKIKQLH